MTFTAVCTPVPLIYLRFPSAFQRQWRIASPEASKRPSTTEACLSFSLSPTSITFPSMFRSRLPRFRSYQILLVILEGE